MNKKITFKFIKYILLYLVLTTLFIIFGTFYFLWGFEKESYKAITDVDETYLYFEIEEKNGKVQVSQELENLINQSLGEFYIVDSNADILYPESHGNVKERILENITSAYTLPISQDLHSVYIEKQPESPIINNIEEVDAKKLIQSLYTYNYNHYDFIVEEGELSFTDNLVKKEVVYGDEFTDFDITMFKNMAWIIAIVTLINIVTTILISILISYRITNPLLYFKDWLENLSDGRLHKPSKKYGKKSEKMFYELNHSIENLNNRLLEDRMYQGQIDYYREKWLNQISHDLKSPLTSIYGYSKLIPIYPKKGDEYLNLISEKAKYMENLIESLNTNFIKETKQMSIDKENFNIVGVVKNIRETLDYCDLYIHDNLENEIFYGNRLFIERMFVNLIDNSIGHNKKNPKIEITFSQTEKYLIINYKDDGKGVRQATVDELGKKKYTQKNDSKNHGIGFTVIQDAVEFHNGRLEIIPENTGVHFKIEFSLE